MSGTKQRYPASDRAMTAPSGRADLVRAVGVISAVSFMLIAALFGVGLLGGTPVQDLQDGALAEDGSWLAPASPAFRIWSVVYIGYIGYAIWQALPAQRRRTRQRLLGWWIAATAVLNGLWLVAAQYTTLLLTVLTIALLLVALGFTFRRIVATRASTVWDVLFIDGAVGLHLGWVAVATVANTAAWLTDTGPDDWAVLADTWGVAVVVLVAFIGIALALVSRGRLAPAAAMAWGLSWIAVARATGDPRSIPIVIAATIAAVVIIVSAVTLTVVRLRHPERRGGRQA
jgi:hypothetical protein